MCRFNKNTLLVEISVFGFDGNTSGYFFFLPIIHF